MTQEPDEPTVEPTPAPEPAPEPPRDPNAPPIRIVEEPPSEQPEGLDVIEESSP